MKRIALLLLTASAAFALAQTINVNLLAILSGTGKGKATWKTNDHGTELQAEIQVEGERQAPNAPLVVTFGSNAPFGVVTSGSGSFTYHFTFHSADRPSVHAGDAVVVSTLGGQPVLTGVLQPQ